MAKSYEAEEKQWQRESDARTLAEAETIKKTPTRLKGAKAAANKMAKAKEVEAKSLKKVAGRAPRKTPSASPRARAGVRSNTNIPGVTKRR